MVVQHNLTAMNSNRMLGLTTAKQAKSTEKLSSGYKINRAADDAAGLTISEKMRRQIRGLTQASLNAQDGISAVQTAEGALTEVHDMLQRMDELATKAANGTMTTDDRKAVQDEIDQLITEVDRVAETTTFNELALLKGDGKETKTREVAQVDVTAEFTDEIDPSKVTFQLKKDKTIATDAKWYAKGSKDLVTENDLKNALTVDGEGNIVFKEGVEFYKEAAKEITDGNEYGAQVTQVTDDEVAALFDAIVPALYSDDAAKTVVKEEELKDYFNADGTRNDSKLYMKKTDGTVAEVGADWISKYVKVTAGKEAHEEKYQVAKDLEFNLHVGAEKDDENKIKVTIKAMSAEGIGIDVLKKSGVMTEDDATAAIDTIKAAVATVSKQRSTLGAVQNRLEHTINNLDNVIENTTSAESQIRDTDMATEMVAYANNNILAQAGQAMLAQSNQANQGVLSLLG